jgi:acetyl-CoA synthetase
MDPTIGREAHRAACEIPVRHCDDYDAAVVAFRWPAIRDRFNWALDWFDPVAAGNARTALRIIGEDGTDRSSSFSEMAARSDRLATLAPLARRHCACRFRLSARRQPPPE